MKITINKNTGFFYIGVCLLTLASTFFINISESLFFYTKMCAYILFILSLLLEKIKVRNLLNNIFFTLTCVVAFYFSKNTDIITLALVGISGLSINFDKAVIVQFVSKIFGIILTLLFYWGGYAKDIIMTRTNGQIRHSFGFIHPNSYATHVAYSSLMYLFIRKNKITQIELLLIAVINIIVSQITGTRTSLLIILLGVFLISIEKVFENGWICNIKKINWFYIFGILSLLLSFLYNKYSNFLLPLDELFSGRLRQSSVFLSKYGISIFGQFIQTGMDNSIGDSYGKVYILDNMYMKLIIQYGCILTIYFIGFFSHIRKKNESNFIVQTSLLLLALYGVSESSPLSVETNFFLLGLGKWVKDTPISLKRNLL